jgi:hypothetical protein
MKTTHIIIIAVIFILLFISLGYSCSNPVPFSFDKLKKWEFPYNEGFSGKQLTYSTANNNTSLDTQIDLLQNQSSVECKKVMGFDGLYCKPYVADSIIDPFFATESSMTCAGSGLTKGSGNVCLNPTQTQLLMTRGGNLTGKDSQIGN